MGGAGLYLGVVDQCDVKPISYDSHDEQFGYLLVLPGGVHGLVL